MWLIMFVIFSLKTAAAQQTTEQNQQLDLGTSLGIVALCYIVFLGFTIVLYHFLPRGKICWQTLSVRAFYRWMVFGCCINCKWALGMILESKMQKKKIADAQIHVVLFDTCSELRSEINSLKGSVHRIEQEMAHVRAQVRDTSTDIKYLLKKFRKNADNGFDPSGLDLPDLCFSENKFHKEQQAINPLPTEPQIQPAICPSLMLNSQGNEDYGNGTSSNIRILESGDVAINVIPAR